MSVGRDRKVTGHGRSCGKDGFWTASSDVFWYRILAPVFTLTASSRSRISALWGIIVKPSFVVEDHLNDHEEDLLLLLGQTLVSEGHGFGQKDPDRLRRFADRWIADRLDELRKTICPKAIVQTLLADRPGVMLMEVTTVADALSALYGKPTASVVALILVRRGLGSLCAGDDHRAG